ncbi:MAG TPA: hypothetical protein VMU51_23460 [Mycobacteriales bacterium]|nr:hypothetical protein [Mycobacteriales bacterium]
MTVADRAGMRFAVDSWDPGYGSSVDLDDDLADSSATVDPQVELPRDGWRPLSPRPGLPTPGAVLFVDGVRRIDAQVWIAEPPGTGAGTGAFGLCASYAAGVVVCSGQSARLAVAQVHRGLFTASAAAEPVSTSAGDYPLRLSGSDDGNDLSLALQRSLGAAEIAAAAAARDGLPAGSAGPPGSAGSAGPPGDDLLVVDGPLRGRTHLPRALGYIKSHRASYLPPDLNAVIVALAAGERTPVFHMGTSWDRYSWYLRLPCRPNGSWAGIVRVECEPGLPVADVIRLAGVSQHVLPRYASTEHKDRRAPQNLHPIAGLERQLRRRLGHPGVLYRALRRAAAGP